MLFLMVSSSGKLQDCCLLWCHSRVLAVLTVNLFLCTTYLWQDCCLLLHYLLQLLWCHSRVLAVLTVNLFLCTTYLWQDCCLLLHYLLQLLWCHSRDWLLLLSQELLHPHCRGCLRPKHGEQMRWDGCGGCCYGGEIGQWLLLRGVSVTEVTFL